MVYVGNAEVQPLETRSAGQSITTLINLMFSFVIGQTYLTMLCSFRWGKPCMPGVCGGYGHSSFVRDVGTCSRCLRPMTKW